MSAHTLGSWQHTKGTLPMPSKQAGRVIACFIQKSGSLMQLNFFFCTAPASFALNQPKTNHHDHTIARKVETGCTFFCLLSFYFISNVCTP
jgi:hypothetical protein